ncbi:MAG: alpha/beta hydrolase [Myxococcota bacterium]
MAGGLPSPLQVRLETALIVGSGVALSRLGAALPMLSPDRFNITVRRDISYGPLPAHRFDLYTPPGPGPHPTVLYIHGGGFRVYSKDTHWIMGLQFARLGFQCAVPDYRLAPAHPFPAGLHDVCLAWQQLTDTPDEYGIAPDSIFVGGESAGANLSTALALIACWPDGAFGDWPHGLRVPDRVMAACGILQVSDTARMWRIPGGPRGFVRSRLKTLPIMYLGDKRTTPPLLADPLLVLEGTDAPARPLPPFFIPVGDRDVLLEDSRRMARALTRRGVPVTLTEYPGEPHGFMLYIWRRAARQCWADINDFFSGSARRT